MNELFEQAVNQCILLLPSLEVTEEQIKTAIKNVLYIPMYKGIDTNKLFYKLCTLYNTHIDNYQVIESKDNIPWLKEYYATHKREDWKFWNRYQEYLTYQEGFAPEVILKNSELTDEILDKLFNPQHSPKSISKKGLIVGQVQSGKTSNYLGLICKAADVGFNLIIVLAGIHNNLRSQTQIRIDKGFLGFDTSAGNAYDKSQISKIGVGLIPRFKDAVAHSYTTSSENGDFTIRATNTTGINFDDISQPIILVVKKNAAVLKRLYKWLKTRTNEHDKIATKPLLLIDDEADNASINTKKDLDLDATAINKSIRQIIGLFERSAYVGYTATPFANIFISANVKDDLFPRNFIFNIPVPSNYIGPNRIFGISVNPDENEEEPILPIVNVINDYDSFVPSKHKKDDDKPRFDNIPDSLKTAVKCFIITCAIRRLRGQANKHNSMLIHLSRFQDWQNHIKELVEDLFNYYKSEIEANDETILEELRKIYEVDDAHYHSYKTITKEVIEYPYVQLDKSNSVHSWEDVQTQLYSAVQKIKVKSINGSSGDTLEYQKNKKSGISVIAIGGDKLSRGLTLEGLSISYFLRPSKNYDTLMQMGRWFGYRDGYVDLCRLFTSSDLNEWFRHIAIASEELREEFDYMASSESTPENYALKVRQHPGVLQITAINKMRTAKEIQVSWGGRLVETYQLSMDRGIKNKNLVSTTNFIHSLGQFELKDDRHYLWRNVASDSILSFFQNFELPKSMTKVNLELISEYIEELVKYYGELNSWSVVLLGKDNSPKEYDFGNNIKVGCWKRTRAKDVTDRDTYFLIKNHIVGNQQDEFVDLDSDILKLALNRTLKFAKEKGKDWDKTYPSPKIVREEFRSKKTPLLMIYPLNPKYANVLDDNNNIVDGSVEYNEADSPFIGFAISFPHTDSGVAISYAVNQIGDFADTEEYFENENDNEYDN